MIKTKSYRCEVKEARVSFPLKLKNTSWILAISGSRESTVIVSKIVNK
ncbi:hypothetical protein MtrunA17_Chr6g0455261 [Medicago truncatula]|uniref:Uncharacterized protein n=1 Tax=Medicago truncatula TaxID=3880 RepID=A0A396HEJ0_MEDTR|nr:hypothetical protein MtrunA17_Chr6g0455261 [Medicago truncatula]